MAAAELNLEAYSDALIILGTAGVVVPIVRRLGANPIIGYLAAGAILGPLGLGSFKGLVPGLHWVTITDAKNVSLIADLGVVFLMFVIGLELSFERLVTMRRLVFGLGGLQVLATSLVLFGCLRAAGLTSAASLVIGMSFALSSTAIVVAVLSHHKRLASASGRAAFAVLLAQDLAVIPLFLLISALSASGQGGILSGLAWALLQAAVAVVGIVFVGRTLVRPLLRLAAGIQSSELFLAAVLFVVVSAGVAAAVAGISMALGAFVAGLILAETEYRKAIEAIIEPFKALLLGLFFFTVGMAIDLGEVGAHPLLLTALVVGLVIVKSLILFGLMRGFGSSAKAALEASLPMGPAGEFAFVGLGLAQAAGIIGAREAGLAVATASLGMVFVPTLYRLGQRLVGSAQSSPSYDTPVVPAVSGGHTIVIGQGRVGRIVGDMLERHGQDYIATDSDPAIVAAERRRGRPVYFGDATDAAYLERCGLAEARAVVVTTHGQKDIDRIVELVRASRPGLTVVARARDRAHACHLYAIGVTDAVPETIEASLQLSEAVLVGIGLAAGPVIASIHEKRDEFRRELQEAAISAGKAESRSVRASTLPRGERRRGPK